MKTTTKIILGLIAASYLMLVMTSTMSLEQPARIFQTSIRGTLKTQKLTAIQAFVALDPYDEESQNYIIELVSDDNAREITVDYPSELVEVKMKGTMLDIITSSEVGKTKAEGRTFEIVERKRKRKPLKKVTTLITAHKLRSSLSICLRLRCFSCLPTLKVLT